PAYLILYKVFEEIPEDQRIINEKLTCSDALYWVLLKKANETFKNAVKSVAKEYKYDLIGEYGAIISKTEDAVIVDITDTVIDYIDKSEDK
ncbi:MAG: hypothetical protein ABIH42_04005, partial [Planctomycetota bacterium]